MYLGGTPGTKRGGSSVVGQGTPGADPWPVIDDNETFETLRGTLTTSTDTTITFSQEVRLVHVHNWSTSKRLLVKDGAISSDTDTTASMIGVAPTLDIDNDGWYPFKTTTIHLRAGGASEYSVEGYY